MTVVPIWIGAFGIVTKWLLQGLNDLDVGGRVGTIQTTALLRTARILRRVLETLEETSCHSNFIESPSANSDVNKYHGLNDYNKLAIFVIIFIFIVNIIIISN